MAWFQILRHTPRVASLAVGPHEVGQLVILVYQLYGGVDLFLQGDGAKVLKQTSQSASVMRGVIHSYLSVRLMSVVGVAVVAGDGSHTAASVQFLLKVFLLFVSARFTCAYPPVD